MISNRSRVPSGLIHSIDSIADVMRFRSFTELMVELLIRVMTDPLRERLSLPHLL